MRKDTFGGTGIKVVFFMLVVFGLIFWLKYYLDTQDAGSGGPGAYKTIAGNGETAGAQELEDAVFKFAEALGKQIPPEFTAEETRQAATSSGNVLVSIYHDPKMVVEAPEPMQLAVKSGRGRCVAIMHAGNILDVEAAAYFDSVEQEAYEATKNLSVLVSDIGFFSVKMNPELTHGTERLLILVKGRHVVTYAKISGGWSKMACDFDKLDEALASLTAGGAGIKVEEPQVARYLVAALRLRDTYRNASVAADRASLHDGGESRAAVIEETVSGIAPGKMHMACVNDGKLVLVRADGTRVDSNLRGETPSLSADGRFLAYTRMALARKVLPTLPDYPQYGVTCMPVGVYLLDLVSGRLIQVDPSAEEPRLAPDGAEIVMSRNESLVVKNLDTGRETNIGKGENPLWIGNQSLLYENDFQIYRYDRDNGQSQPVLPAPGTRVSQELSRNPSRLLEQIFAGTTFSTQTFPRGFAGGTMAAFAQLELGLAHEKASLVTVDGRQVRTSVLLETRGADFSMCPIKNLAVSPDGRRIAYVRTKKQSDVSPPETVAVTAEGKRLGSVAHVNIGGSENVYVALFSPESNEVKERVFLGAYRDVSRLEFWDTSTLLIAVLDTQQTQIKLRAGTWVVGMRALDPVQLAMMGLDTKIADADVMYRIDLETEQGQPWLGGHSPCVAAGESKEITSREHRPER